MQQWRRSLNGAVAAVVELEYDLVQFPAQVVVPKALELPPEVDGIDEPVAVSINAIEDLPSRRRGVSGIAPKDAPKDAGGLTRRRSEAFFRALVLVSWRMSWFPRGVTAVAGSGRSGGWSASAAVRAGAECGASTLAVQAARGGRAGELLVDAAAAERPVVIVRVLVLLQLGQEALAPGRQQPGRGLRGGRWPRGVARLRRALRAGGLRVRLDAVPAGRLRRLHLEIDCRTHSTPRHNTHPACGAETGRNLIQRGQQTAEDLTLGLMVAA